MRRILVDHARKRRLAASAVADFERVTLSGVEIAGEEANVDVYSYV